MWNNFGEAGRNTDSLRLASNNNKIFASCETPSDGFPYGVAPIRVSASDRTPFELDDATELDEVLDNVNRLLESLNTELDDACSDDENRSDSSSPCDVAVGRGGDLIAHVRAKTTAVISAQGGQDAEAGAGKQQYAENRDNAGATEKEENGRLKSQSRSDECPARGLLEGNPNFHQAVEENGARGDLEKTKLSNDFPCANSEAHKAAVRAPDSDISPRTARVATKERTLPKAKSQGALCIGSLNIAKSIGYADSHRLSHSTSVDRSSPVISRHQSFQAYKSAREKPDQKENDCEAVCPESEAVEAPPSAGTKRKSKTKTFDRIESWFTSQQEADDPEDGDEPKQTKRFASFTHSAPFKFAQQFIPGSKDKRKLSATKSLPVTRKSLKRTRQNRTAIGEVAEVKLPPFLTAPTITESTAALGPTADNGCLLTGDEERQVGQKPPSGLQQHDSTAAGSWVKHKFSTINKSFLVNFKRSVSLDETNRRSLRTPSEKRSPNLPWKADCQERDDYTDQSLVNDMRSNHVSHCIDQSITVAPAGTNRATRFDAADPRPEPLFFLFDVECAEMPTRRATMDSSKRPTQLAQRKNTSFSEAMKGPASAEQSPNDSDFYSSLPREGTYGVRLRRASRSSPSSMRTMLGDSAASSEESVGGEAKVLRTHSDRYLKKQAAIDGGDDVVLHRNATNKKGAINKIRKSLKHVGKTSSSPTPDEMAERTWGPHGNCTWSNMSGRKMQLGSTRLQSLSELECDALQKVAVQRLAESELGVAITVPKDDSKVLNRKISMRKKYAVHLSTRDKNKDKGSDHVFGIPLVDVVENDQLLRLQKFATTLDFSVPNDGGAVNDDTESKQQLQQQSDGSCSSSCSGSVASINQQKQSNHVAADRPCGGHKCIQKASSCESLNMQEYVGADRDSVFSNAGGEVHTTPHNDGSQPTANSNTSSAARPLKRRGAIAADSLNEIDPYQSQLLEALSLSVSSKTHSHRREKKRSLLPPTMAQVPYVVQKCCDHITKYGLDVTGIFRVPGSKKRVKQLREEFDRGVDVTIDEDYNPHDVAALLKEFFRDLPEALLTRELYNAFVQTAKLPKSERLPVLRSLIWLLPLTNRDTLYTLMSFLGVVAAHADDSVDGGGNKVTGNKMDVSNLATIFGPNILHRYKKSTQGNENQYQVQSLEKAEDSSAVITIVEEIIANHMHMFQIVKYDHDQMLRTLNETDPEAVDFLLRRKAANYMREKSKLLSSQSKQARSPNNNNNSNNHSPMVTPKCQHRMSQTTAAKDCRNSEENGSNSGEDNQAEQNQHSSMRLSYQQATGHVIVPPKGDSDEKGGPLKFIRPIFKPLKTVNTIYSDVEDLSESGNNSSEGDLTSKREDEDRLIAEPASQTKRSSAERSDPRVSSSSMWSFGNSEAAAPGLRSMSFTEDDMQDILQPSETDRVSTHSSPSTTSIPAYREAAKSQSAHSSAQDLRDEVFSESKRTPPLQQKHEGVTLTLSAESGICVDSSPQATAKEPARRRGGFSVRQDVETAAARVETELVDHQSRTAPSSSSSCTSASTDSLLSVDDGSSAPIAVTKRTNRPACPPYKEAPVFTSKMSVKFTANLNSNNNNNNNNSITYAEKPTSRSPFNRRSSQVIRLCENPDATSAEPNAYLSPSQLKETPVDPLRMRKRLPSSLSPRFQRRYGGEATEQTQNSRSRGAKTKTSAPLDETRRVNERPKANGWHCDPGPAQYRQMEETVLGEITPRYGNTTSHRNHEYSHDLPSSYRTRHGRRFSKDDLSLPDKQVVNVSKWTSSGLIPKNINLNASFTGGSLGVGSRSSSRLRAMRDEQQRLPETWV